MPESSSTMATEMEFSFMVQSFSRRRFVQRQGEGNGHAAFGRGGDGAFSTDFFQAAMQIIQAVAGIGLVGGGQAAAVVDDADGQAVIGFEGDLEADFGGAGMADDIGERFFEGEKEVVALLGTERMAGLGG